LQLILIILLQLFLFSLLASRLSLYSQSSRIFTASLRMYAFKNR
jgi:hypothetical protein